MDTGQERQEVIQLPVQSQYIRSLSMPHSLHSLPLSGDPESEVSAGEIVSQDVETWRPGEADLVFLNPSMRIWHLSKTIEIIMN